MSAFRPKKTRRVVKNASAVTTHSEKKKLAAIVKAAGKKGSKP